MVKKQMETGLMIRKDTILAKIKRGFFTLLFYKERKMLQMFQKLETPKAQTKEKIIIPKDMEKEKIIKLQESYQKGLLEEKDIKADLRDKLKQLYKAQNILLRNQIRGYKQVIIEKQTKKGSS